MKARKPKTHKAEIFRLYASDPTEDIGTFARACGAEMFE